MSTQEYIIDNEIWTDKVRLVSPSDRVLGGLGEPANWQASDLANRTKWLKARYDEHVNKFVIVESNIKKAQATADQAKTAASTADSKAVKAQTTADQAKTAASTADSKAVKAQTTADQAKTAASTANTNAIAATSKANEAELAAHEANKNANSRLLATEVRRRFLMNAGTYAGINTDVEELIAGSSGTASSLFFLNENKGLDFSKFGNFRVFYSVQASTWGDGLIAYFSAVDTPRFFIATKTGNSNWSTPVELQDSAKLGNAAYANRTSSLSDNESNVATPKMVNDVHRAVVIAQQSANAANEKANQANTNANSRVLPTSVKSENLKNFGTYYSTEDVPKLSAGSSGLAASRLFVANNPGLDFSNIADEFLHFEVQASFSGDNLIAYFTGYNANSFYIATKRAGSNWKLPTEMISIANYKRKYGLLDTKFGTTYTNNSHLPLTLLVSVQRSRSISATSFFIDNNEVVLYDYVSSTTSDIPPAGYLTLTFIIPPGSKYRFTFKESAPILKVYAY